MAWSSLGTLSPGREWQTYPIAVTDVELIRIVQTVGPDRSPNPALLAQEFPGHGFAEIYRVWAMDDHPRIIGLPIPPIFKSQGITTYQLKLKLGRFPHMGLDSWQVEVQAFYP